jgi:uncharacterized protein (DUF433 family)
MSTVAYPHIEISDDGKAFIVGDGFRFKVRMLVQERLATGADAEEIQRGHPQLTLSQIYSALAYYYDHKAEIDYEIEQGRLLAEEMRAQQGESSLIAKAKAAGRKLP